MKFHFPLTMKAAAEASCAIAAAVLSFQALAAVNGFESVSDLFAQMSDPSRIRIFWMLCHCEECEPVAEEFGQSGLLLTFINMLVLIFLGGGRGRLGVFLRRFRLLLGRFKRSGLA